MYDLRYIPYLRDIGLSGSCNKGSPLANDLKLLLYREPRKSLY